MELEEYIKKNINDENLRQNLLAQGFLPRDFDPIIENLKKKKSFRFYYYIFLISVLVLAIIYRLFFLSSGSVVVSDEKPFSVIDVNKDLSIVNLEKINSSIKDVDLKSGLIKYILDLDEVGIVLEKDQIFSKDSVFSVDGFYLGNHFNRSYYDSNSNLLVNFSNEFIPNDGIIQTFVIPVVINGSLIEYVIVDSDWKNKIVPSFIRFGQGYVYSKVFDYSMKLRDGLYIMKINNSDVLQNNLYLGGLVYGDITDEKIRIQSKNLTVVRVR